MNTTLKMDRAGRLVLPKPVREQLQLEPGEPLELESFDDHIVLRPVRGNASMYKKQGVWVFRGGAPLKASVVRETIRRVRKDREQAILLRYVGPGRHVRGGSRTPRAQFCSLCWSRQEKCLLRRTQSCGTVCYADAVTRQGPPERRSGAVVSRFSRGTAGNCVARCAEISAGDSTRRGCWYRRRDNLRLLDRLVRFESSRNQDLHLGRCRFSEARS